LVAAQPAKASETTLAPVGTRAWLWPNLLSLDAPIVAVLWQALFARCFHAPFDALATTLLVLSVWLIYAADRSLDVWKKPRVSGRFVRRGFSAPQAEESARHQFYRRHWHAILPLWIAILAIATWLAWTRLPAVLFERGLALLAAIGIYFAFVHLAPRPWWPKEFVVGILFALGASLSAWGRVQSWIDAATIVLFCMLCWINCSAIEHWENRGLPEWPVRLAAIAVGLIALIFLYDKRPILAGAETASAFGFVLLDRARHRLSPDALRVLADIALLTPALFLPIAGLRP
jgi:hypothetical protein